LIGLRPVPSVIRKNSLKIPTASAEPRKSTDRQYSDQIRKRTKGQRIIYKTLHGKLKIGNLIVHKNVCFQSGLLSPSGYVSTFILVQNEAYISTWLTVTEYLCHKWPRFLWTIKKTHTQQHIWNIAKIMKWLNSQNNDLNNFEPDHNKSLRSYNTLYKSIKNDIF
jgi:hypothetical protein